MLENFPSAVSQGDGEPCAENGHVCLGICQSKDEGSHGRGCRFVPKTIKRTNFVNSLCRMTALVSYEFHNKLPQTKWFKIKHTYSSTVLEFKSLE